MIVITRILCFMTKFENNVYLMVHKMHMWWQAKNMVTTELEAVLLILIIVYSWPEWINQEYQLA